MKIQLEKTEKNALAAILLCLFFYVILPFVLVRFFPSVSALLKNCHWVLIVSPMIFISSLLYLYSRETFITKDDFRDLPVLKIGLCSLGMLPVCGGVSYLWLELLDVLKIQYSKNVPIEDFIRSLGGFELAAAGIFICILTPLFEETVFRRVIFSGIRAHCLPVTSTVITSMLFAILHGILFQLLPLFVLGLYFQILVLREKRLGASIFAHFINNTIAFAVLLLLKYTAL